MTAKANFGKITLSKPRNGAFTATENKGGYIMTDAKTLAYINMYAVLGAIENLCELDEKASELVKTKKPVSVGLEVKGGPSATLFFKNGRCRMEQGTKNCDVLLPFSTPEKFNAMVDGTGSALPSKGFSKIAFLLKRFIPLTDILSKYLRASEEDLKDDKFFEISTKLMFFHRSVTMTKSVSSVLPSSPTASSMFQSRIASVQLSV